MIYDGPVSTKPGSFGQWLWDQLVDREWNRSELARRVGVEPTIVSRWVNDKAIPEPESCRRIAQALGIPARVILEKAGHLEPDGDLVDLSDPLTSFAAANQHLLTPAQKRMLIQLAEEFLRERSQQEG